MIKELTITKLQRLFPGCKLYEHDSGDWPAMWTSLLVPDGRCFFGLFPKWKKIAALYIDGTWRTDDMEVAEALESELGCDVYIRPPYK